MKFKEFSDEEWLINLIQKVGCIRKDSYIPVIILRKDDGKPTFLTTIYANIYHFYFISLNVAKYTCK